MNVEDLYKGCEFTRAECIEMHVAAINKNPTSFEHYMEIIRQLEQEKREAKKKLWDKLSK